MELGLSLPLSLANKEKMGYLLKVEKLNFDSIWVGDTTEDVDVFGNVEFVLNRTNSVCVWTGVTSPFYYSIESLAEMCHHYSQQFPSRFGLGLGIGSPTRIPTQYQKKPVHHFKARIKAFVDIIPHRIAVKKNRFIFLSLSAP